MGQVARVAIAAALLSCWTPMSAHASGCVDPVVATINFARGAHCWTYQGRATEFRGTFRRGQTIAVSSTGVQGHGDGRWEWLTVEERELDAVGPDGEPVDPNPNGDHSFVAPLTGAYSFSFSPCSMWHWAGTFIVCAR